MHPGGVLAIKGGKCGVLHDWRGAKQEVYFFRNGKMMCGGGSATQRRGKRIVKGA